MSIATAAPPSSELNDPEFLRQVNELRRTDNVTNWFYLAREYAAIQQRLQNAILSGGAAKSK